jgi:HlyD family secretion protein
MHSDPLAVLLASALCGLASACTQRDAVTTATGTIEMVESDITPTAAGRVSTIHVTEGAVVRAGDTLVTISSSTAFGELRELEAAAEQARAELRDVIDGARPHEIARAAAEVRTAEAEEELAAGDFARRRILFAAGAESRQQLDSARSAAAQAAGRRDAARSSLELLRAGARPEAVAAAQARIARADAALAASRARAADLVLLAPLRGRVRAIYVDVGELAPAGRPVLTITDDTRPWVRVFADQEGLGRIDAGQAAVARLDDGREFAGRVVSLSPEAEFTPRVALTEDERADLMFGVKIELEDREHVLRAGLPVTVELKSAAAVPGRIAGTAQMAGSPPALAELPRAGASEDGR